MGSEGDIALVMGDDEFEKHELDDDILEYSGLTKTSEIFSDSSEMDEQTDLRIWLFRLLNDAALEQYKDVEFVINSDGQDRVVKAHRLILTTRSRTFAVILDKEPDHKTPVRINGELRLIFRTGERLHHKRGHKQRHCDIFTKLHIIQDFVDYHYLKHHKSREIFTGALGVMLLTLAYGRSLRFYCATLMFRAKKLRRIFSRFCSFPRSYSFA